MDTRDPWTKRLKSLLSQLERTSQPSIVLLESRSGLHDIAAATVTDLGAEVLLFAIDSESHWTGYDILFRHWQGHELATTIRERLSIVSRTDARARHETISTTVSGAFLGSFSRAL